MIKIHTVVEGDTLSALAEEFYGDAALLTVIAEANGLRNSDDLEVGQLLAIPDLDPGVAPASDGRPRTTSPRGTMPYASEPFGLYQPLLGWRSTLHKERLKAGLVSRFEMATNLLRSEAAATVEHPVPALAVRRVADPTGTEVGRTLAARAEIRGGRNDAWQKLLADSTDSALTTIAAQVVAGLQQAQSGSVPSIERTAMFDPAGTARNAQMIAERETRIRKETATASLLRHLAQTSPTAVAELFSASLSPGERAMAALKVFAERHPAKDLYLSPIGILHRFREYFFELGTFLGPPVGHVWLSPGGTIELVEVNARRSLTESTVEQSTQTTTKNELGQTNRDELSDAVKVENANDMKLGVGAAASGGVGSVFQASGSASFNLDASRKQAQEQTHKRMREQTSKLSSEVQQNYKTTFRTVTETTDTSSRRYVLQNTTAELVSYELSRKMRRVAVQVQDLGQQLCWQLYIDNPGLALDTGEFVHETAASLDPSTKRPDATPVPADKPVTIPFTIPFLQLHGGDDDTEDTYTLSPDNHDHGRFKPDAGEDNIIQFRFTFPLPLPPEGYELSKIGDIDFKGEQVKFTINDAGLQPNPNVANNSFSLLLTYANFGGKKQISFEATLVYTATKSTIDAVNAKNAADQRLFDDQVAATKEKLFYETLRKRLKRSGNVLPRRPEDLREEERTIICRAIISRLYGKEKGWTDDDYHVASELIRYFFDVDAMLYFVAPDWWRPRAEPLTSVNKAGEYQSTTLVDPKTLGIGRVGHGKVFPGHAQHYLFTEETRPAPLGASLGWFIELDGDPNRNAFLNSPWVKAVLPIRPGRERDAIAFLRRPEVAGTDGLDERYPFDPAQDPPEYDGLTLEEVLLAIADKIAQEQQSSLIPIPVRPDDINSDLALPTETVFATGFDPLAGGIKFGKEPFKVFSQWTEVLPSDQIAATEYSLQGLK